MSAINFVVRDDSGNISRGAVAAEGHPASLIVGSGADISLNLTAGQIISYTRQGQALEITLVDGRTIVIEGYFTAEGVAENTLLLSSDGYMTEVNLTQGAGADYYANYVLNETGAGKYAADGDLYFMRSADVMLAEGYVPADDEVGMLGTAFGAVAPALGLGGAAAAGAAAIAATGGGGGGGGGGARPVVEITSGTESVNHMVNAVDHSDGVEIGGTGTPGATVEVLVDGHTETTTVADDGTWSVTFAPEVIATGNYATPVEVTISNGHGTTTVTDALVIDTVIDVDMDATGGADGIVSASENAAGVTLSGTVTSGDSVTVTVDGVDYAAVVTGTTWTLDLGQGALASGEYDLDVTVTATDAAGNVTSSTSTVVVDTVTNVSVDTSAVGGADAVVNGAEAGSGVTLTGTAQPGATVVVTFGALSQTVTATAAGTWEASYDAADVPTGETDVPVTVTATDAAGNTATDSGTVTVDTYVNELSMTSNSAGGTDGIVNFNESGQPITMGGTVEAGSSVMVDLHGVSLAATVDANGNWTVTYPPGTLPGGEYDTTVTVTATDAAGNSSTLSETVTVDTVAGDLALSTAPIEIDDVVNAAEHADGVIINGTATPGLTVTVGLGNATLNVVAGADGTWSVNFPASMVPQGTYDSAITASITDAAGNFKEVSDTVRIDTEVTPFNFASAPVEGDDVINGAEAADGVVLSGEVEAHSFVQVDFGGQSITVQAGADGQWSASFPASAITGGEYMATMTATATDPAGNTSVITDTVQVDTIVSRLTSSDPVEGDNIVNAAEASDGITLNGTVEVGSSVLVTFEGTTRAATVDAAGNWSVDFAASEVPAGQYDATVTIAATDPHGNTDSITDTFHVDTTLPDAPAIESVTLTGDGVEYLGIASTANDVTVTQIDENGNATERADGSDGVTLPWGETLFNFGPALSDGSHLVVNETDSAGNANATYVVLEETGTNVVDTAGLDGFDIGAIDLSFAKDSDLTLDLSTLEGLSDANNTLTIHGGADDSVTLSGASASGQSTVIDGTTYDIYTMGTDGQIFIEEDINVTL